MNMSYEEIAKIAENNAELAAKWHQLYRLEKRKVAELEAQIAALKNEEIASE